MSGVRILDDIKRVLAGSPTPLILRQRLASKTNDPIYVEPDVLATELFDRGEIAQWRALHTIASAGLLLTTWEAASPFRAPDAEAPLWQFFRHVRNAAAHNSRVHLRPGQPDKPAIWKELSITASVHGLPLFHYPPDKGLLSPGDCLYLLADIEAQLMP
jgi:hypothetical protein